MYYTYMRWVAQTMRLAALVPPGRQCGLRHNGLVRCCSTGTAGVSEALEDVRGRLSTVSTEAGLSKPVSIHASNTHAARPRLMVRLCIWRSHALSPSPRPSLPTC